MKIRIAHRMQAINNIHLKKVRTAQQTQAIESIRLQEGPNANAMIADNGGTLCNRRDTKVTSLDAL
jgi:hypothetical protein